MATAEKLPSSSRIRLRLKERETLFVCVGKQQLWTSKTDLSEFFHFTQTDKRACSGMHPWDRHTHKHTGLHHRSTSSLQPWACVGNLDGHHDLALPAGITAPLAAHPTLPGPRWRRRGGPAEVSATVTGEQPSILGQSLTVFKTAVMVFLCSYSACLVLCLYSQQHVNELILSWDVLFGVFQRWEKVSKVKQSVNWFALNLICVWLLVCINS